MRFSNQSLRVFCTGLIFAAVACGKTKDKSDDSPRGNPDDAAPAAIQVGEEFSFSSDLVSTDADYRLVRRFTFTIPAEQNLRLRENMVMSMCEGDGDVKDVFELTDATNTLHLSTAEAAGFTLVAEADFPGKVGGNSYTLTATYSSASACSLEAHYVVEAIEAEPTPTPAKPKTDTPVVTPTPVDPVDPIDPVDPVDPTDPVDPLPTIDAAFAKNWLYEEVGIVKDEIHVGVNGKATEKVWVMGELFVDIEMDLVTDVASNPDHVQMTVTKVNYSSPDAGVTVGQINRCIYEATAGAMKLECGEGDAYPTVFSADATAYVLQ